MDPLSPLAILIALVETTRQVIIFVKGPDRRNLNRSLAEVYELLLDLRDQLDSGEDGVVFDAVESSFIDLQERLEDLAPYAVPATSGDSILKRTEAAFSRRFRAAELQGVLSAIDRVKATITAKLVARDLAVSLATNRKVDTISRDLNNIKDFCDDNTRTQLVAWLGAPDHTSNYHIALQGRQARTGEWLIESDTFQAWKQTQGTFLWMHAIPGCGKTLLSAKVIDHIISSTSIASEKMVTAYFFFDYKDKRKREVHGLLASLLTQLWLKDPEALRDFREKRSKTTAPSVAAQDLQQLLHQALLRWDHVYLIIDALDECTDREDLLQCLTGLVGQHRSNLHLLATSRPCDIAPRLSTLATHTIDIDAKTISADIELLIDNSLASDDRLKRWTADDHAAVRLALVNGANGMFLWVAQQLNLIRKCKRRSELHRTLKTLPKTLIETYDRIMDEIEAEGQQTKGDAIRVMQWIIASAPKASCEQLAEMLAVRPGPNGGFDPMERYQSPKDVLNLCPGLIREVLDHNADLPRMDSRSNLSVQFVHLSVLEYLRSDVCRHHTQFNWQECNRQVLETCLKYSQHVIDLYQLCCTDAEVEQLVCSMPLTVYALCRWHWHDYVLAADDPLVDLATALWIGRDRPAHKLLDFITGIVRSGSLRTVSEVYQAVTLGSTRIVSSMALQRIDLEHEDSVYGTPLQVAVEEKEQAAAWQLLSLLGADPNATKSARQPPLLSAAQCGYDGIANLLLEEGADPNLPSCRRSRCQNRNTDHCTSGLYDQQTTAASEHSTSSYHTTPLDAAVASNGLETVYVLLRCLEVNINQPTGFHGSALNTACYLKMDTTTQYLLDAGADPHIEHETAGPALHALIGPFPEVENGRANMLVSLLESGADLNYVAQSEHALWPTVLHKAVDCLDTDILPLLIVLGADARDPSLIMNALRYDRDSARLILKYLVYAWCPIDAEGVMEAAIMWKYEENLELLVELGAELTRPGLRDCAVFWSNELALCLIDAANARQSPTEPRKTFPRYDPKVGGVDIGPIWSAEDRAAKRASVCSPREFIDREMSRGQHKDTEDAVES